MTQMVNAPVPFPGTPEERQANFATHAFGEERCMFCDCRHVAASYPCGVEPPRAEMPEETYAAATGLYGTVYAAR